MLKLDPSLHFVEMYRLFPVADHRLLSVNLADLPVGCERRRDVIRQPSQHFHRPGTVSAVLHKRHQRAERHLTVHHKKSAKDRCADRQRLPHKLEQWIIAHKHLRLCNIELIIAAVVGQELLHLVLLPRKRLHRPDAGKIFLRDRGQRGILLTDLLIYLIQLPLHHNRHNAADNHCKERHKRQLPVAGEHTVEHKTGVDDDLDHEHPHKTERIPDPVNVVLDPRHQLKRLERLCNIIIRPERQPCDFIHGQRLKMIKQILPHLRPDLRRNPVK